MGVITLLEFYILFYIILQYPIFSVLKELEEESEELNNVVKNKKIIKIYLKNCTMPKISKTRRIGRSLIRVEPAGMTLRLSDALT